jgi:hypothetical protein
MNAEVSKIFKYKINLGDLKFLEEESQNTEFLIKIDCLKKEVEIFQNLIKQFFTKEEIEKCNFSVTEIPNINLKIDSTNSCHLCQIVLNIFQDLQYYCVKCEISFCRKCVRSYKNKDKSGLYALVHKEHYLIAFKNPNKHYLENIEKYKLGNNLFSMFKEDQLKRIHNFGCDMCDDSCNFDERYICLTCRPGLLQSSGFTDICAKCFRKGINKEHNSDSIKVNKHKSNHVFLHMVYSGVDYYSY